MRKGTMQNPSAVEAWVLCGIRHSGATCCDRPVEEGCPRPHRAAHAGTLDTAPMWRAVLVTDMVGEEVLHELGSAIRPAELLSGRDDCGVSKQIVGVIAAALEVAQEAPAMREVEAEMGKGLHHGVVVVDPSRVRVELSIVALDEGLDEDFLLPHAPDLRLVQVNSALGVRIPTSFVVVVECCDNAPGLSHSTKILCDGLILVRLCERRVLEQFVHATLSLAGSFGVIRKKHISEGASIQKATPPRQLGLSTHVAAVVGFEYIFEPPSEFRLVARHLAAHLAELRLQLNFAHVPHSLSRTRRCAGRG
mmetsp:Transcript_2340/g.5227  ORF Transcript_2340/g.5227 Transcript_2340/m.5227 type:complete len:307 (-) Transcript_2340:405-1325(-)